MTTPEAVARRIIERANGRIRETVPYMQPFGKSERDAPMIHALIAAVAGEILALDERVRRLEATVLQGDAE